MADKLEINLYHDHECEKNVLHFDHRRYKREN